MIRVTLSSLTRFRHNLCQPESLRLHSRPTKWQERYGMELQRDRRCQYVELAKLIRWRQNRLLRRHQNQHLHNWKNFVQIPLLRFRR